MHKIKLSQSRSVRNDLQHLINGGCLSKQDLFLSIFFPGLVFGNNARFVSQKFNRSSNGNGITRTHASDKHIKIMSYKGNNIYVRKMMILLNTLRCSDLIGAYVHGSLGNLTEIDFSDFDALVILKNDVLKDWRRLRNVARKLCRMKRVMLSMDPLQHHGWFVLTEEDLENWPQTYFPVELFEYAKSLFPVRGGELKIRVDRKNQDYLSPFMNLADSILRKLEFGKCPKNLYTLKNLSSEFMLLPSLYVQVRDKRGVFKKFSFDLARKDFSEDIWSIMDDVSFIRQKWNYPVKGWRRILLLSVNPLVHKLAIRLSPEIPIVLRQKLSSDFYHRMKVLVEEMKNKCK